VSVSEATKKVIKIAKSYRGFLIVIVLVLLVIGSLVLYSGAWPPLVVVESRSMQHSSTESYIGTIDTGDMVILKKLGNTGEIRTYLDSLSDGYQTYGEYGDVVIYRPFGSNSITPIIHRSLLRMEYNVTGGGFDIPALGDVPSSMWSVVGGPQDWHNLKAELVLTGIGYNNVTVRVNVSIILNTFAHYNMAPFGGLVTLGDNNRGIVDQMTNICWAPVKADWVNGVARGELPWFGLLKLWITGPTPDGPVPENSKTGLFVSLGLLVGVPVAMDLTSIVLERQGKHPGAWLRAKLGLKPKVQKLKDEAVPNAKEPEAKTTTGKRSRNKNGKKKRNR